MTNPPKQKGTAFETLIVNYLREFWPHVERRTLSGSADKGDIAGMADVIECKNVKSMSLGSWLDEAEDEAENAGVVGYVVIHKRRGKASAPEQFVTMPLWHYVELSLEAEK